MALNNLERSFCRCSATLSSVCSVFQKEYAGFQMALGIFSEFYIVIRRHYTFIRIYFLVRASDNGLEKIAGDDAT